jgi:hypothetical protein
LVERASLGIANELGLYGDRFLELIGAEVHVEASRGSRGHVDIDRLVATAKVRDENRLLPCRDSGQSKHALAVRGRLDRGTRNRKSGTRQRLARRGVDDTALDDAG